MPCRNRDRCSARATPARAGARRDCRKASAIATRSPAADRNIHERQEEAMAGTTHVYAGVAATVGMEHSGTLGGVFRQEAGDKKWEQLKNGLADGAEVHAITVHPTDSDTVFVGSTKGLYRSADGGEHWKKTANPGLPNRVHMAFACRVMRLDVDPNSPDDIYATMEANGAMRSRNAGESWEDCTADLIRCCEEPNYRSRIGIFRSNDRGEHWQDMEISRFSPLTYGRDIRVSPHDPKVMYACLSPAARSTDGSIYRSEDVGQTWKRFDHGVKAEATMMGVAVHPRDPNQVYGASRFGQVFGTQDGGRSWSESRLPE